MNSNESEAIGIWFLRRMLRISWTAEKTNKTVIPDADIT